MGDKSFGKILASASSGDPGWCQISLTKRWLKLGNKKKINSYRYETVKWALSSWFLIVVELLSPSSVLFPGPLLLFKCEVYLKTCYAVWLCLMGSDWWGGYTKPFAGWVVSRGDLFHESVKPFSTCLAFLRFLIRMSPSINKIWSCFCSCQAVV